MKVGASLSLHKDENNLTPRFCHSLLQKYMASEGHSWDTSTAHIRRMLRMCIEAGRRADGDECDDLWDSFRLLGTALHTLEDLLAHSKTKTIDRDQLFLTSRLFQVTGAKLHCKNWATTTSSVMWAMKASYILFSMLVLVSGLESLTSCFFLQR